jgi:hypothetical protein
MSVCALEGCGVEFESLFRCSSCELSFCANEFNVDNSQKRGLAYKCRECQRAYHAKWRIGGKGNFHSRASRYGLGPEKLQKMIDEHDNRCAACGGIANLFIDHDHSCCEGKTSCGECVRGMLCMGCNLALGNVGDSAARLLALISYLGKWS